jgi:chromosome segregation ATPase
MAQETTDDVSVADEAVAAVAPESPTPPVAAESPAADLNAELQAKLAEIEALKKEQARLQEDLQTTINGKSELAGQLDKTETELKDLKARIAFARTKVREFMNGKSVAAVVAAAKEAVEAKAAA